MRINDTVAADGVQISVKGSDPTLHSSMKKLSSDLKIDPNTLAANARLDEGSLKQPMRGSEVVERLASDAASMLVVADSGAMSIESSLRRMRELAAQSSTDTVSDQDRAGLQKEYEQLSESVTKTAQGAKFRDKQLLSGGAGGFSLQMGSAATGANISYAPGSFVSLALGNVASQSTAAQSLSSVNDALSRVNDFRASVGGSMNRLEQTVQSLSTMVGNHAAMQKRIRDVEMAQATTKVSGIQIQERSQQSMAIQGAQLNTGVMGLLQGGVKA